ncbi:MAG TPA: YiiX/YebB-like N1pC/P60 family cysteine hydrolase, partial [Burkholderiaceae bacterium]|nr:YiiX/YebB-like N1pC/P60 family cysteine hydrolase [Burkholderiaceae bacterium]
ACRMAALAVAALLVLAACATRIADRAADGPAGASGKAIAFQRKSLTPTDGGRLVRPEDLQAGDILLSADPGIASAGIRLFTISPVSHAAIYVGDGEVAEALRGGVRLRGIDRVLEEESVVAAFRHPALDEDRARQMSRFAREQVGKPYDFVGVMMHAPFALQRRVCELPGVPTLMREACLSTLATFQLIHGGDDRFFCSQFVLESYRVVGLPITRARPHWVSPEDIMHMRAGDVSSLPVEQPLMYVGHLKFTGLAMPLPGLSIPLPLPSSGEAQPGPLKTAGAIAGR